MPAAHKAADSDPSFVPGSPFVNAAHYCNVPREVDPEIAACSFINSGLRVFDIRDPLHPREIAYFVSPPGQSTGGKSDAAFSQPAFDPARRDIWYTDAVSGFWVVHLKDSLWPHPLAPATTTCASRRSFLVHIRRPRHGHITSVRVVLRGKRVAVRRHGSRYSARIRLTGLPRKTVHVHIRVRTSLHKTYDDSRTYHPCRHRAPRA